MSVELRELESRRQKLQSDISQYNQKIEELKQELLREQTELERLKISVEQAQVAQREAVQRNTPTWLCLALCCRTRCPGR